MKKLPILALLFFFSACSSSAQKENTNMPKDLLIQQFVEDAYGNMFNYWQREERIDNFWKDGENKKLLLQIIEDKKAAPKARFLACEVLYQRDFTFVKEVGAGTVAEIYATALQQNLAGNANNWGLLYEHNDAGPCGQRLIELGEASLPYLLPLLDDKGRDLMYEGSEEATIGNAYHFRTKDFAAYYIMKITQKPFTFHMDLKKRDEAIEELKTRE